MKAYFPLLKALGMPDGLMKIVRGRVELPRNSVEMDAYGFPPALIPLWMCDDPAWYFGAWKHHFTQHRSLTFVTCSLENRFCTTEHARTFEQLVVLECNEREDADDTERAFLAKFGIDESCLKNSDGTGYYENPVFKDRFPVNVYSPEPEYTGDFPHRNMDLTEESIREICGYEVIVPTELRQRIRESPFCPPWLVSEDQADTFDSLLNIGDKSGAWMSLNSPGWNLRDQRDALAQLLKASDDPLFQLQAKAWLSLKHEPNIFSAFEGEET
jgi:hypothetical protein